MSTTTGMSGGRPMIQSARGVVSSGHYLATQIGLDVLREGGNAFDAAAATGFALTVVQPHQNGIGGEVPMVVYSAAERKVRAVSGHGIAPRAATLARFRKLGLRIVPGDGLLPAVAPSAFGSWILLLRECGTMRLSRVLGPAVELARVGVPMYDALRDDIVAIAARMRAEWPSSAEVFLPGGEPPKCGTIWRQPDWAATFGRLAALDGKRRDRAAGLRAAYNAFYRGEIAERIVAFVRAKKFRDASGARHGGLLTMSDFGDFKPRFEEAASATYRGVTVHKCGPWTQGPVLLQALTLLEGFDLAAMGHNSVRYIHTVAECMKLAFADREFYYGDPEFAAVPMSRLLSKEYAAERRRLVDPQRASHELRPGGHAPLRVKDIRELDDAFSSEAARGDTNTQSRCDFQSSLVARDLSRGCPGQKYGRRLKPAPQTCSQHLHPAHGHGDTTKLEVIDAAGNMVSATPSGGWLHSSPVIPGLGFPLGNRGQMFSLAAGHPNCLAPGKRPRTTLTPSLATRNGEPWMAFGSPGGDLQDQWALQFLLNVIEFGMPLQEAVEAPTFWTRSFPSSFYPRAAEMGSLYVEDRIGQRVRAALAKRGHVVKTVAGWAGGNTLAAEINPATGVRSAAASPRLEAAYAGGW